MITQLKIGIVFMMPFLSTLLIGESDTEKISRTFNVSGNGKNSLLIIDNIQGNIEVDVSDGNQVQIEATKLIEGDNTADLQKGKSEINVEFEERNDSIIVYMKSPYHTYKKTKNHYSYVSCQHDELGYDYKIDFKVKVPANLNMHVHTINRGNVEVKNVKGVVDAKNINGSITLENVSQLSSVHTINGNIDVTLTHNPPANMDFKTINGTIKVNYKGELSADIESKSFHGEFYTDHAVAEYLPIKVEKSEDKKQKIYKINKSTRIRIGKGGPVLKFETLNGDVFLSKK